MIGDKTLAWDMRPDAKRQPHAIQALVDVGDTAVLPVPTCGTSGSGIILCGQISGQ